MTAEQFCYWLQGRAEMQPDNPPNLAEWAMIRDHLQTVFVKVTPLGPGWSPPPNFPGQPYVGTPRQPLRAECLAAGNTL